MNVRQEKDKLRREYLEKRRAIPDELRRRIDRAVCDAFLSSATFNLSDTVLAYAPKGAEVDVMPIVTEALRLGKRVAFPRCEEANALSFRYARPEELIVGAFGIREPHESALLCDRFNATVCLVPALLFDREGYRIGYGKGYYDRFLASVDVRAVGIARHDFILPTLPRGRFDRSVDMLVSETEVLFLS